MWVLNYAVLIFKCGFLLHKKIDHPILKEVFHVKFNSSSVTVFSSILASSSSLHQIIVWIYVSTLSKDDSGVCLIF